jgi:hypothetical protein
MIVKIHMSLKYIYNMLTIVNTVTQHAHNQRAAHPNGAQSSLSTQKIRKRDTIKTSKSKNNL